MHRHNAISSAANIATGLITACEIMPTYLIRVLVHHATKRERERERERDRGYREREREDVLGVPHHWWTMLKEYI